MSTPKMVGGERKSNNGIPNELAREVAKFIQMWKQDVHDQKEAKSSGGTQILKRIVNVGGIDQLAALTKGR